MRIGEREIGPTHPPYFVAELSANHAGKFERAVKLVQAAAAAGVDAVKIQTYTPDTMTIDSDLDTFRVGSGTVWEGRTLYDLYQEAQTPWEWHEGLQRVAREEGIAFFSTPFDETAVDFLEDLDVPAYKIASFELIDIPLLERVAKTGKPVILSTGMGSSQEIQEAVATLHQGGVEEITLLVCTSAYPARPTDMNLRRVPHLSTLTGLPIGLSDHSLALAVPVSAVALGACLIEKHFTLSRGDPGPDASFSLEPTELAETVTAVKVAWEALGDPDLGASAREDASLVFRRSLFVVEDVGAGDAFTRQNVRSIRPGYGLPPRHLSEILGARSARPISRGTPLSWDLVAGHGGE